MAERTTKLSDTLLGTAWETIDLALPARQILADRYFLHRRLGSGGFGVVYEAEDLRDGGFVALKLLREGRTDFYHRFKREFRALQGVVHQNLIKLYELFGEGNTWFYTMDLIEGLDFVRHVRVARAAAPETSSERQCSDILERAPAPPELMSDSPVQFDERRLRDCLRQLLQGLSALHAAHKVHRDIKPSNVLVDHRGCVTIIDFGLATDDQYSTDQCVVGTPVYMAPEQATAAKVGPGADLYSVGVMLYEALTGSRPLEGPPLQVLLDKQSTVIELPASVASRVPADLRRLCESLLRLDPDARPSAITALSTLVGHATHDVRLGRHLLEAPLIGRDLEFGVLGTALAETRRGRLRAVLIEGQSGIGKSALMRWFCGQMTAERPEIVVLESKCYEREAIPYKGLDGIVDSLVRRLLDMPRSEVAAILPTQRQMLTRVFPSLSRIPELAPASVVVHHGVDADAREQAFSELRELFVRLAMHHPTVVCIDDMQWADEDGLRGLASILRQPGAPAILVVGTWRLGNTDDTSRLTRLRADLAAEIEVLRLDVLRENDAIELTRALLPLRAGDERELRRIAIDAGGHPLFIEELARHIATDETAEEARLDVMLWDRIARLEPSAKMLVQLVAVAGKPLPVQVAVEAGSLETRVFQRGLAQLRQLHLVRESGARGFDAIEPYHDRVREAVLDRLTATERLATHRALARAFEGAAQADPEALATHFREAGDGLAAVRYAIIAGQQAAAALAFERAVSWFEGALDLLPESDERRRSVMVELGHALALAGRGAIAASHFLAAAKMSDADENLELRRRAAEQLLRSGHFDRGIDASRLVLASIGMRIPRTRLTTMILVVFYGLVLRIRGSSFEARDPATLSKRTCARLDACMSMAIALGFVVPLVGFVFQRRALLLALRSGHAQRVGRLLAMEAAYLGATGAGGHRTRALLERSGRLVLQDDSLAGRAYVEGMTGIAHYANGSLDDAARHLTAAFDLAGNAALGLTFERVTARMFLIRALALLGHFRALCEHQRTGLREALARGDVYASVNMRVGFASLTHLIEDRPRLGASELSAAMAQWSTSGFHIEHFFGLLGRAWNSLYSGDVQRARDVAAELLRRTRGSLQWRIQICRVMALYVSGGAALALAQDRPDPQSRLLRVARHDARALERESIAMARPFARVLHAGVALQTGDSARALRELRAAQREFSSASMSAYAAASADRAARLEAAATSAEELESIARYLRTESVVAPERMVAMLIPGVSLPG